MDLSNLSSGLVAACHNFSIDGAPKIRGSFDHREMGEVFVYGQPQTLKVYNDVTSKNTWNLHD